jgi:hypothetical protein
MTMEKADRKVYFFAFFLLIAYLLSNTGLFSDDIPLTLQVGSRGLWELVTPKYCVATPAENYFFYIWYPFLRVDDFTLAFILKIIYMSLSFYCVARFFTLYTGIRNACLFSFLFLFFPSHDSTVYWFLGEYLTLSAAFYLYAFYLADKFRTVPAAIFAALGSFISYGSPALALGLSVIFLLRREFGKMWTLLLPNIAYCLYYVFTMRVITLSGIDRIPTTFNAAQFAKSLLLQAGTFFDSIAGPSMWLKMFYSIREISIVSAVIGLFVAGFVILTWRRDSKPRVDVKLLAGLAVVTGVSFVMFALTGRYPQIAFNLGNRVTIFGSLFIVYLIMVCPARRSRLAIMLLLVWSILGLSDHWKTWSERQKHVIKSMESNKDLALVEDDIVYITGNQYSKLGKIGHIEFLSEPPVTSPLIKYVTARHADGLPLNRRYKFEGGSLVDTKYGVGYPVGDTIVVYDSEKDALTRIKRGDIAAFIRSLPHDVRHWIQLVVDKRMEKAILYFMPYLKYAFKSSADNG